MSLCAKDFFTDSDLVANVDAQGNLVDGPDKAKYVIGGPLGDSIGIAYDGSATGMENMLVSPSKTLVGNAGIRKNSPATLNWP